MAEEQNQNITQRSMKGAFWSVVRRLSANIIRLVAVAILARHLSPAEFGLVALAQVILQFAVFAQESGIGTYVIYDRDEGNEQRTQSAFWLNIVVTLGSLALFGLSIPVINYFYPKPDLLPILIGLAAVFFLRQFSTVPEALLQRELDYHTLFIRNTVCEIGAAVVSVLLALAGWGVWSIVAPLIVMEPIRLVSILYVSHWKPQLQFGVKDWKKIWHYSKNLMLTNFLILVFNDSDTLLVGRLLGNHALGYYNLAWQFSNLINKNVSAIVGVIGLPALAMLSNDRPRLQAAYCRILRILSCFNFPALCGMLVLADDLIRVIYGPGWGPVGVLLRIFIVFTLVRSVTSQCAVIYNVVGRTDIGFKFNLVVLPFYLGGIYIGSNWGLVGVALGVTLVRSLSAIIAFLISVKLIDLKVSKAVGVMFPVSVISGCMSMALWALHNMLVAHDVGILLRIGWCTVIGAMLFVIGLACFDRETYREVTALVTSLSSPLGKRMAKFGNVVAISRSR
jgi:O-antigen/teichoic acid export membrane protein